jgi:hypothetical protein
MLGGVTGLALVAFELAACQASVYTADGELAVARLLRELVPAYSERFAGEPQVVSHPASPHPRILLRSATGMWRCEIAADRTDFYWLRPEARAPAPAVDDFFQAATGLLVRYADVSRNRVSRFAAIVKRLAPSSTPALAAISHIVRPDLAASALDSSERFQLHTHKRQVLDRFVVNASVRWAAEPDGTIGLEQDLNTLAEQAVSRRFTLEDIAAFFRHASREHERVVQLYFPPR